MSSPVTYSSNWTRKHRSQTQTWRGKNGSIWFNWSPRRKLSHKGDIPRSTTVWRNAVPQNLQAPDTGLLVIADGQSAEGSSKSTAHIESTPSLSNGIEYPSQQFRWSSDAPPQPGTRCSLRRRFGKSRSSPDAGKIHPSLT